MKKYQTLKFIKMWKYYENETPRKIIQNIFFNVGKKILPSLLLPVGQSHERQLPDGRQSARFDYAVSNKAYSGQLFNEPLQSSESVSGKSNKQQSGRQLLSHYVNSDDDDGRNGKIIIIKPDGSSAFNSFACRTLSSPLPFQNANESVGCCGWCYRWARLETAVVM